MFDGDKCRDKKNKGKGGREMEKDTILIKEVREDFPEKVVFA